MDALPSLALAHLRLSVLALSLGVALAVPLSLASRDRPRLARAVLTVAGIVQTVPGLALLAAMVPLLAALGAMSGTALPAIGELPAVLALSLYAVLPIVRGAVLGLGGIDAAVLAAADAVGMTRAERLRLVELPLALPHVVGGLRTATVWIVGMATLATPVGARSLGQLIFAGLQTRHHEEILLGCVAAAGLALALDALLAALERAVREPSRKATPLLVVLGLVLAWAPVHTLAESWSSSRPETVVRIGAKGFTEQRVLAALLARSVRDAEPDANVEVLSSLGTSVAFDALARGELDLYVEYTGTVWTTLMRRDDTPPERARLREQVEQWLRDEHGVQVVCALGFENAYALVVPSTSRAARISDLGRADDLVLATDYEFLSRAEWTSLERTYGLVFRDRRPMDPALLYDAVARSEVDVATGFTTDPQIAALRLRVLEDDRGAIPPYDAIVLARTSFLEEHPELARVLGTLEASIDADAMRAASLAVDRDRRSPEEAAASLSPRP